MNAPDFLREKIQELLDDPRFGGKNLEATTNIDRSTFYNVLRTGRIGPRTMRRIEKSNLFIATISTTKQATESA